MQHLVSLLRKNKLFAAVLAVELASMLLLAGLVVAFHVGREERAGEVLSNRKDDSAKRKTEEHA